MTAQHLHPTSPHCHDALEGRQAPRRELVHPLPQLVPLSHHQLRRRRRGRGPKIRHEIRDGDVGFVPHRGDDGDGTCRQRARHDFFIERPEVLQRSAAAGHDQDVQILPRPQPPECGGDLPRRAGPLDRHRVDQNLQPGKPPPDDRQHVADHGTRRGGDDADLSREKRERPLAAVAEESLCLQLGLELLEGELEGADPLGLHELGGDLVIPPPLVDRHRPAHQDRQSVRRLEPQTVDCGRGTSPPGSGPGHPSA